MSISTATIDYDEALNDDAVLVNCVFAICDVTNHVAGPVWGHGEASVKRALATLTEECTCGARFHAAEED